MALFHTTAAHLRIQIFMSSKLNELPKTAKRRSWHQREPERVFAYFFVLPSILLIAIFRMYPLLKGLKLSFTDANGATIGFENYSRLFSDDVFIDTLFNTVKLLSLLPIWVIVPMTLAILIYVGVPGGSIYRISYFFPVILSTIIIGSIFNIVLQIDGPINDVLGIFNISAVDWLGQGSTALFTVAAVQLWATFGINVLIFISALSVVPQDLVDASKIDGANLAQSIIHVIIPSLRSTIEFVAIASTIGMLTSMFGLVFIMTGGGPDTASYLPEYFIWLQQGRLNNPTYASAASMVLFVVMIVLTLIQIRIMSRNSEV